MEDMDGVCKLDGQQGLGGERDPGLVIEEVEDLDRRVVGELPWRGVQLPGLVGERGFESDKGRLRTLVGLRGDEPVAFEDPPHGRNRRQLVNLAEEVMSDRFRPGVVTGRGQLVAKPNDLSLDIGWRLQRAGARSTRARL